MEIIDTRTSTGNRVDPEPVEVNGVVEGFAPGHNKVLIKRLPAIDQTDVLIIRPGIATELAERGYVVAVGTSDIPTPPTGVIAKFSKYCEEIHFDDEGTDSYALPWVQDIRGWHNA